MRGPLSLCLTAASLAEETWTLLETARLQSHRGADERAFTDHNMLWMHRNHPHEVRVALFTQHHEAVTGADFEWWVTDGNLFLPMLVQAKRLDLNDRYPGLRKKLGTRGRGRQLNRLIDVCTKGAAGVTGFVGHLPVYLFYNGPPAEGMPGDRCCGAVVGEAQRGCTLASAFAVRRELNRSPRRGSTSISRIGPTSLPWACAFCCPHRGRFPQPEWIREMIEMRQSPGEPPPRGRPPSFSARLREWDEVPDYVSAVAAGFDPESEAGISPVESSPGAAMVVVTVVGPPAAEADQRPPS